MVFRELKENLVIYSVIGVWILLVDFGVVIYIGRIEKNRELLILLF